MQSNFVTDILQVGEFEFYRDQLWTAPELLRMTSRPLNGTPKADVYSFAIIVQEIVYRAAPYFIDLETPKSVYYVIVDLLHLHQILLISPLGSVAEWAIYFTFRSLACSANLQEWLPQNLCQFCNPHTYFAELFFMLFFSFF